MVDDDAVTNLSGSLARAIGVTWAAFRDRAGDVDRYAVRAQRRGDGFEVAFVLRPEPGRRGVRGSLPGDPPQIAYEVSAAGELVREVRAR